MLMMNDVGLFVPRTLISALTPVLGSFLGKHLRGRVNETRDVVAQKDGDCARCAVDCALVVGKSAHLSAIIGCRACVDGANAVMMSRPAKPARVNMSAWVFGVYIELFNLSMP